MGALTGKNTVDEQLSGMHAITSKDNVHLTDKGYAALAQGLVREARGFELAKQKGKGSIAGNTRLGTSEWHGFISNQGAAKGGGSQSAPIERLSKRKVPPLPKEGGKELNLCF